MKKIIILVLLGYIFSDNYIMDDYEFKWTVFQYGDIIFSVEKEEDSSKLLLRKKDGYTYDFLYLSPAEAIEIGKALVKTNSIYKKFISSDLEENIEEIPLNSHTIIFRKREKYGFEIKLKSNANFGMSSIDLERKEAIALIPYLEDAENLMDYVHKTINFDFIFEPEVEFEIEPEIEPEISDGPDVIFIPFDRAPIPKNPIRPKYPELARESGIEGTIIVQFFINEKGKVTEAPVIKGIPDSGLDEAALDAVKKSTWKPARQRDKKVGVWQTVPVRFQLN